VGRVSVGSMNARAEGIQPRTGKVTFTSYAVAECLRFSTGSSSSYSKRLGRADAADGGEGAAEHGAAVGQSLRPSKPRRDQVLNREHVVERALLVEHAFRRRSMPRRARISRSQWLMTSFELPELGARSRLVAHLLRHGDAVGSRPCGRCGRSRRPTRMRPCQPIRTNSTSPLESSAADLDACPCVVIRRAETAVVDRRRGAGRAMPSASSSAMCLSRATGSRPVQPAITAWSDRQRQRHATRLAVLNGEGEFKHGWRSSMPAAKLKDAAVEPPADAASIRPTGTSPSRCARQRDRAAIERVDQRAVAQRAAGSPW
jgi:hypothetical protein